VLYTAAAGTSVKLSKIRVTNADGSARNVTLTIVKSGGTSGATNKIMSAESVAAGARVDLGSGDWLGEGDFISAFAPSSTNVDVVISGIEFGGGTGSALTGIQDDAIGTGGRTASSGTVGSSILIGNGSNRYLVQPLICSITAGGGVTYASYDTLTVTCTDGAMTRLTSVDFNQAGNLNGSIHLFGRANPTSSSTQTITANVVESGKTFNLTALPPMSLSGVASVTGAATTGPSSAAAMSLAVTSAVGHRVLFAAGFDATPMDPAATGSVLRTRGFNGNSSGTNCPHWGIFADALGAATVTATASNSTLHAAVGLDVVPA
jgi:hypothetical protein